MERDSYWDSLKFVLIFFVVFVHTIERYLPIGGVNEALYNLFHTFVMPVFIFVSGMFSHIRDREKYKVGILHILETYIVFQVIVAFVPLLISGNVTLKSITKAIAVPGFALWYLLSLVSWRLIVYFLPEKVLREHRLGVLVTCLSLSLLAGFVPVDRFLSMQRTMTFLPFFFMGYYARDIDVKKYIAKIPRLLAISVLASLFLFYYLVLNQSLFDILSGCKSYWSATGSLTLSLLPARLTFLIGDMVMGCMVMRLVPSIPSFSRWGRISLFIYVYHIFAVLALRSALKRGYLPYNEWMPIVCAVVITACLIALSRIKFLHILLNPISSTKPK